MRNRCRSRSEVTSFHMSWKPWPLEVSVSGVGSSIRMNTSEASAHIDAPPASSAASDHCGSSLGINDSARPIARVKPPASAVARPVMSPRWPLEIVRPWTSLPAMEQMERNTACTASRTMTAMPSALPSSNSALSAMPAEASAWPHEPINQTRLRELCDVTHGLKNACGSIEPDSRIGTRNDVNAAGTPAALNSHGSTVFGATT